MPGRSVQPLPEHAVLRPPPIDGAFSEYVVVHSAFAHPVPDEIVTGHYGLDQVEDALEAGRRDEHSVKVLVHPNG